MGEFSPLSYCILKAVRPPCRQNTLISTAGYKPAVLIKQEKSDMVHRGHTWIKSQPTPAETAKSMYGKVSIMHSDIKG